MIQVREALEQTKAHSIRFKAAKTRARRRDITVRDRVLMRCGSTAATNLNCGYNSGRTSEIAAPLTTVILLQTFALVT